MATGVDTNGWGYACRLLSGCLVLGLFWSILSNFASGVVLRAALSSDAWFSRLNASKGAVATRNVRGSWISRPKDSYIALLKRDNEAADGFDGKTIDIDEAQDKESCRYRGILGRC